MSRNILLVAAIVVIAGYFYFKSTDKSQEIITSQTSQVESPGTAEGQAEAPSTAEAESSVTEDQLLVENLIKEGIIEKIDTEGETPKVYVTARFYTAPNVDKKAILEVLLKDFRQSNADINSFDIYDAKSGEEVGIYDSEGLKIRYQ